jgi:hypothetical protein
MKRTISHIIVFLLAAQLQFALSQTFSDVSNIQGINSTNTSTDGWGSGVSFYDFNQDGWDDLSFAKENGLQGIYLNNQGSYQQASFVLSNFGETKHLLWVDYDNDGALDIFITTKNGKNYLYKNDGNFNFTEVTASAGIYAGGAKNYGASFGDYNKDGFLDLYVCKYGDTTGDTSNLVDVNNLYRNNGDGTFTDVSFIAGVSDGSKPSFCSVWFDYNKDSWPDLYVVNDRSSNAVLYRNNGDGTFSNVTVIANLTAPISNFMTASIADYNNDNDLDLFVSNTSGGLVDVPKLFDNTGSGYFTDLSSSLGLVMPKTTWGGLWLDYNNDSKQDLYVATAFLDPSAPIGQSYFFKNLLPATFVEDSSLFIGNHSASSHAVSRGDLNNDGFYDIAVQNESPYLPFLWQNSGNSNNYIKISLEGTVSNSMAIGSWIKVFVGGQQYTQYTLCGENYLGQNSQHHIFGVGNASMIDSITVEYTSGIEDKYYNLPVNQNYQFLEGGTVPIFTIPQLGSTILCLGDSAVLSAPFFESYTWNTGDTTRQIEVWQAGNYSLTAIDSNGLINYSNVVEIDVLPDFIITANSQNMHCAELNDGEINLVVDNQGIPYTVEWNHGAIGDSLFNLNEGTYVFNYLDSFACQYTDSVQINAPFPINVQSLVSPQTPDTLGAISLNINGGFPPFQIFVDDVLSSTNINNLNAGFYSLEIIDENGCSWEQELEVIYLDSNANTGIFLHDDPIFQVYPLPFKDHITLSFFSKTIEPFDLNLFSEEGRLIVSQSFKTIFGLNELRMEIAQDIPAGLYMLELRSQSDSSSKILIKF